MQNIDKIKSIVDKSPTNPGIYKMLDENQKILYVGKAKNIKNRLKNYLNDNNLTNRIKRLMRSTRQIDTIVTETEKEALLLEANLIKKIKPQYNILLRDDKSFPYIFINHEQEYPRISKHRGKQKFKGKYFGPFATVGSLNYTLKILQKVAFHFFLRRRRDVLIAMLGLAWQSGAMLSSLQSVHLSIRTYIDRRLTGTGQASTSRRPRVDRA